MQSPLSANDNDQQSVDGNDGRSVHLIYSEYDSAPSETEIEVIEGAEHYWWQSSKSNGREVCFVYSDYDEPSSETTVEMSKLFCDNRTSGREVRLIYSDYDEPPSETDVEYDGRLWCSIFGNPTFWKIQDKGRELHLIYSDYTEPKSEAVVEIDCDTQFEIVKSNGFGNFNGKPNIGGEISWSTDNISSSDNHSTISSDIYTRRPPDFCSVHITDSLEFIGENANENSVFEYFEGQELNTAKDDLVVSSNSTHCDTIMENAFVLDHNVSSNYG